MAWLISFDTADSCCAADIVFILCLGVQACLNTPNQLISSASWTTEVVVESIELGVEADLLDVDAFSCPDTRLLVDSASPFPLPRGELDL